MRACGTKGYLCVFLVACRYYEQYGSCARCPTIRSGASVARAVVVPIVIIVVLGVLYRLRNVLPQGMLKVGSYNTPVLVRCSWSLSSLLLMIHVRLACKLCMALVPCW